MQLATVSREGHQGLGTVLSQNEGIQQQSRSSGNCAFKQPETTNTTQSVSQEWNYAFKQPGTLDMALDSFHRIYTQT